MSNYPECPTGSNDCRFYNAGGYSTAMWSPIEYDRDGKPVGGGMNSISRSVECLKCGKVWQETRTELETAQGKKPQWNARPTPEAKERT